jgi:anaerobic dimethyl sulfoxide reductase subunit B (iron-sulfur subunit)
VSRSVFVIDLARCTGCYTCSIACKDRARLPDELDWLRIETDEGGRYPEPTLYHRVVHCFHCDAPRCAEVCPTAAIARESGDLIQIDAELCIACGACVEACPFSAIVMCPEGTTCKCDGCADEVALGWDPTCVRACPMRALQYGPSESVQPLNRTRDPTFDDHGIGPAVLYMRRADDE